MWPPRHDLSKVDSSLLENTYIQLLRRRWSDERIDLPSKRKIDLFLLMTEIGTELATRGIIVPW